MTVPQKLNDDRARAASAQDRELALLVLVMPRLLALLTDQQQRVLFMRAQMEGASWPEVAAALGMSRPQAWGLWKRAIAKLPATTPELDQARQNAMNPLLWQQAG
jgi:DNA-directed RNA polymerase specialized sigma24 family protein